jgi:hypothetical protein
MIRTRLAPLLSILVASSSGTMALAQSTAFTYQGRLKNGGNFASGRHDLRFSLFNAATAGTQVGVTVCADNVAVDEGWFTTTIDFGQRFATTQGRFLEIEVRRDTGLGCGNTTGFTRLTPRQPITATPMASHARSAFALDASDGSPLGAVIVDSEGRVGIGTTTPAASLDVRGGPMLVENIGDQADLLWLSSERSWVFRQEGTGAGTALKLESIGGGGNKHFIVQTTGLVGIGTASPQAKLDVRGDIRLGSSGQFQAAAASENLRMLRGSILTTGAPFFGSGWTSSRIGTGRYSITYNTPFADAPTVVASAATGSLIFVTISNDNGAGCQLVARDASGVARDISLRFIAVGAR